MALDLSNFFDNLRSYTTTDDTVDEVSIDSDMYGKKLSDMTEDEKEQFYQSKDFKD